MKDLENMTPEENMKKQRDLESLIERVKKAEAHRAKLVSQVYYRIINRVKVNNWSLKYFDHISKYFMICISVYSMKELVIYSQNTSTFSNVNTVLFSFL